MVRALPVLVAVVAFAAPLAAHASGSSVVDLIASHYKLEAQSVRKIFARDPKRPNAEGEWHKNWQDNAAKTLARFKATLDKDLAKFQKTASWELAPWADTAKRCETPDETRCRIDLRVDAPGIDGLTVMIIPVKPMTDAARSELTKVLEKLLRDVKEP